MRWDTHRYEYREQGDVISLQQKKKDDSQTQMETEIAR
jgi:hypothetical protein